MSRPWWQALVAAFVAVVAPDATARERLPPEVQQALHQAGVPDDALAAVALPLQPWAWPWRWRDGVPMQPGSAMKLVTTVVALDRLGPNHRGHTELRSTAPVQAGVLRGDLVLQGVVSIDTVIATMKPEATHWARSCPMAKCRLMSGTATFTMVDDMIEAIEPTMTATSSSQR